MNKATKKHVSSDDYLKHFLMGLEKRNPGETEYIQAVCEVASSVMPYIADKTIYREMQILERMSEPERLISFRVPWTDDDGNIRTERGWRVQCNSAIGPYKGGIRFHAEVNQSILKFLAFEQTFKNSLTGLSMGGAKGGSNFNPKGRSDGEIMRFCQSFMTELYRYIGEDTDVPAGDMGVGEREIGYMFGQYKRITNRFAGVMTGKGIAFGGSKMRVEATGCGAVFFVENMLEDVDETLEGKKVLVSGSGNVAIHAAEKLVDLGAKVITLSDSDGFVHCKDGFDAEQIEWIKSLKSRNGGRVSESAERYDNIVFHKGKKPWRIKADIALPCATQNEIDDDDARALIDHGVCLIAEGANMPCKLDAVERFIRKGVLFGPAKAVNAGGVGVSGLEMAQNSARLTWDREHVTDRLRSMMRSIHQRCVDCGKDENGKIDYRHGANIAGFVKVADAMLAYGHV